MYRNLCVCGQTHKYHYEEHVKPSSTQPVKWSEVPAAELSVCVCVCTTASVRVLLC